MVTVQDAGLAVFRVIQDDQTSEDKIEWLLLQSSKCIIIKKHKKESFMIIKVFLLGPNQGSS